MAPVEGFDVHLNSAFQYFPETLQFSFLSESWSSIDLTSHVFWPTFPCPGSNRRPVRRSQTFPTERPGRTLSPENLKTWDKRKATHVVHEFFGNTADVDASAAQTPSRALRRCRHEIHHRHLRSQLRRFLRARQSTRTSADHHQVKLFVAHAAATHTASHTLPTSPQSPSPTGTHYQSLHSEKSC